MDFNLSDHLKSMRDENTHDPRVFGLLKMKDGASMSVQASSGHYCYPRENYPEQGWQSVEAWCFEGLTARELFEIYGDNSLEDPAGWVPVELIERIIENHGGLA